MEKKKYSKEQTETALKVDLRALLNHFGFYQIKGTLFENPFRNEQKSNSFSVFRHKKTGKYLAKDLSNGKTWNCIDFIQDYKKINFIESIEFLLNFSGVFVPTTNESLYYSEEPQPLPIFKPCTKEQENNLNYYLKIERGVSPTLARKYIKYLQYEKKGRTYYALCFRNNSKGYSIRNPKIKRTFGIADFTTIEPQDKHGNSLYSDWIVFEGFVDFLSALTYFKKEFKANIMILNSTSFRQRAINYMLDNLVVDNPTRVFCFLDNDETGEETFELIFEQFAEIGVFNYSKKIYPNHKDFNVFLTSKIKSNENTQRQSAIIES